MCLNTCEVALEYSQGSKAYIGEGWKSLYENEIRRKGRWFEAGGDKAYDGYGKGLKGSIERSSDGKHYIPGFHIFLKKEDANKYGGCSRKLVKVAFKEILAFGTNETNAFGCGPCVVARYMKVLEVMDKENS